MGSPSAERFQVQSPFWMIVWRVIGEFERQATSNTGSSMRRVAASPSQLAPLGGVILNSDKIFISRLLAVSNFLLLTWTQVIVLPTSLDSLHLQCKNLILISVEDMIPNILVHLICVSQNFKVQYCPACRR